MSLKIRRPRLPDGGHKIKIALRDGKVRKEKARRRRPKVQG